MIASNEEYWKKYQLEPEAGLRKSAQTKKARLIHSSTDPEESFNTFRGGLIAVAIVLVIVGIVWLMT